MGLQPPLDVRVSRIISHYSFTVLEVLEIPLLAFLIVLFQELFLHSWYFHHTHTQKAKIWTVMHVTCCGGEKWFSFVEFHFKTHLHFLYFLIPILSPSCNSFIVFTFSKLHHASTLNVYVCSRLCSCAPPALCTGKRKHCPNYSKLPVDAQTSLHSSQ